MSPPCPSPSVHLQSHAADYSGRLQLYQIAMRHPMVCFAPWSGRFETIGANYPVVHSAAPRQQLNNCSCLSPCRLPTFPHLSLEYCATSYGTVLYRKGASDRISGRPRHAYQKLASQLVSESFCLLYCTVCQVLTKETASSW